MRLKHPTIFFIVMIQAFLLTGDLMGQQWEFIKERDGIKIYTRNEEDNPVKSFKGVTDLHTSMERVSAVVGRIESFDWWDENIRDIKVLDYQEEKYIKYYLVYDIQWPISDRDLCVEAVITNDPVTGKREVRATPLTGVIPEKPDIVRIKNYWQTWTFEPEGNGMIRVILEGSVDPGGIVPSWLVNMVITETPLKIMRKLREQVED